MTLSEAIARFVVRIDASAIGAAETGAAKAALLDTLGCMLAGSVTQTAAIVRENAQRASAPGASTIVGGTPKLSAQAAALCNGTSAHALDYDDILWSQIGHPSSTVMSAALAVAEETGASGADLILAYALGVEVIGKLGRAVNPQHYEHGWHATASIGVIGSAAACSKLLGLNERQTAMAIGIAASEAGGVRRNFGTMTKPFHAGDAARAAVLAAELASAGFTSDLRALEGDYGWAKTMNGRSVPDARDLESTLGKVWELVSPGIVLKRYPACGATHCALDAVLWLREQHTLRPAEIQAIECHASPFAKKPLLYSRPVTGLEGKFSMEFSLALAILEGAPRLRHFEDSWTKDARVAELLPRISFLTRDDLAPDGDADAVPAEVTIHARGARYTKEVRVPIGDPRNPMRDIDRHDKFSDCAGLVLAGKQTESLLLAWERAERILSVRDLTAPLHEAAAKMAPRRDAAAIN